MVAACYDSKLAELLLPAPSTQHFARGKVLARLLVHPRNCLEVSEKRSAAEEKREREQLLGYLANAEDQIPRQIHRTLGIWPIDAEDYDF